MPDSQLLHFIPNQPFVFKPDTIVCDNYVTTGYWQSGYTDRNCTPVEEDCCNACQDPDYCQMIQPGDPLYVQLRQRKGADRICQPILSALSSSQYVANGDFPGPTLGPTWDVQPRTGFLDAWMQGTNQATATPALPGYMRQVLPTVAGKTYRISLTVSGVSEGQLQVTLGGMINPYIITADGTYIFNLIDEGDHTLTFTSQWSGHGYFNGSLSEVTVLDVLDSCWQADNSYYTLEQGFQHVAGPGHATTLTNSGTDWLHSGYYAIKVLVKNRTAGTLSIQGQSNFPAVVVAESGEQTRYLYTTGELRLVMSDDFDGTLCEAHLYPLYSEEGNSELSIGMALYDMEDNFVMAIRQRYPDQWVRFTDDYITVRIPPLNTLKDDHGDAIPYGCYKIKVADPLATPALYEDTHEYVGFAREALTRPYYNASSWTLPAGSTLLSEGSIRITADGTLSVLIDPGLDTAALYKLFAYLKLMPGAGFSFLEIRYGGNYWTAGSAGLNATAEPRFATLYQQHTNTLSGPQSLTLQFTGVTGEIFLQLSSVLPCSESFSDFSHESNCFCYCEKYDCTKVITSYAYGHAHGFYFPAPNAESQPDFLLRQRVRALSFNPTYPSAADIQIYSNGDDELTFSQRKKYKTLHLDRADEAVHDCVSIQLLLSHLYIDAERYVAKKQDYTPEWDKDGRKKMAQARVEVAKKNNNTFFSKEL